MTQRNDLTGRRVLVTGASGILGRRTVSALSEQGCLVHALVRTTSKTDHLRLPRVTIFKGDVADAASMRSAFAGVEYVVHAAADTTGSEERGKLSTIQGTQNVLDLCSEYKIKKLVYISSCNVYGISDYREGQLVHEGSSLERYPEKRGPYSFAKHSAEQLVLQAIVEKRFPIVCLRPGTYFGPGCEVFTPMMGFSLKRKLFAIIGTGQFVLPLVIVDNLVDAIITSMQRSESNGRIYNVVESDMPTKRQYADAFLRKLYPDASHFYIPYALFSGIVRFQEWMLGKLRRKPVLTVYRLESSQKNVIYDASKIRKELGWTPPMTMQQAYESVLLYERGNG